MRDHYARAVKNARKIDMRKIVCFLSWTLIGGSFAGCASSRAELTARLQETRIANWIRAVERRSGWNASPERQANHGRVQLRGVFLDDRILLVATPRNAATVDPPGRITHVALGTGGGGALEPIGSTNDVLLWAMDRPWGLGTFNFIIDIDSGAEGWG